MEEIFFPGEFAARHGERAGQQSIDIPAQTWSTLEKIAAQSGVRLPAPRATVP